MKTLWIVLFALILTATASAQTPVTETSSRAGFVLYRCDAATDSPQVTLSGYLTTEEGGAALAQIETVELEAVGFSPNDGVPVLSSTTGITRNPIRLVIVLDTTSTMPLLSVINMISTQLFPQLQFADEVALITFSQNVSPVTPFFTDKNRLVNEDMIELQTSGGSNRLYDAIMQAVQAVSNDDQTRDMVMVITDSSRNTVAQASTNDIVSMANQNGVQIYPIGLVTEDTPDKTEILALAERTNGFAWYYNNPAQSGSQSAVEAALTTIFRSFITLQEQEVALNIDVSALTLDDVSELTLKATLILNDGAILTDTVVCPVPVTVVVPQSTAVPMSITFSNPLEPVTTTDQVEVVVNFQTTLPESEQLIVFLLNGQIVQSSQSSIYTFTTPTLPPGVYAVTAQLRDLDNTIYATSDTAVTIYAQQVMQLNTLEGDFKTLDTPIRLQVLTNPTVTIPDVRFTIASDTAPETLIPLGTAAASVVNGTATFTLANPRAEVLRLFPDATDGKTYTIQARIPSPLPNTPDLVPPQDIAFTYASPPPPAVDTQLIAVIALCVALFILNVILLFRVRRARVRRMFYRPDNIELPNRLMAVTVYRDALKHTHTLTRKTITVGRGSTNDVNLGDDNKVSRQHGVIMWRKNDWYYTNRKADVFVRIGGKKLRGFRLAKLEPVTELEIGDARVYFHSNSQHDITELTRTNL